MWYCQVNRVCDACRAANGNGPQLRPVASNFDDPVRSAPALLAAAAEEIVHLELADHLDPARARPILELVGAEHDGTEHAGGDGRIDAGMTLLDDDLLATRPDDDGPFDHDLRIQPLGVGDLRLDADLGDLVAGEVATYRCAIVLLP